MSSKPPSGRGDRPDQQQGEGTDRQPASGSFGSFVSDSVRRSASRFRGEPRGGDPSRSRGPGDRSQRRRRHTEQSDEPRQRRATFIPPAAEQPQPERHGRGERPDWLQAAIVRAGGIERALAALAIVLVAFIALIWLLATVLGGDDDGDTADPTPTESLQLIPASDGGTPAAEEPADDTPEVPADRTNDPDAAATEPSGGEPTPTERGSDNVLDRSRIATPTPVAQLQPVSCDETCLLRIEATDNAEAFLAENGTRPSYVGDNWLWAIAEPGEATDISSRLETTVIRESAETLRLYMVVLPNAEADAEVVSQFGAEVDSVGAYRLIEVGSVPANVRAVIDAGMVVEKVAPAPPESLSRPGERPTLEQAGVGSLAEEVDPERITSIVQNFQATGSNDGSGIGTRYYTTPGNQIAADELYRTLESFGLDAWYEDFVTPEGLLLVNVLGELPGSDPSRLYGVLAHFDTISDSPEVAAPGADDNASGIAATLEIARILSGYDLTYSFRVIFVNAEEVGILGAEAFARRAVDAGDPWEGIFNIDSVGSARNGYQVVLNALGDSVWMEDLIARVNDEYGIGESLYILQTQEVVADDNRLRDAGLESVLVARELYGWSPYHHSADDVFENVSIPHVESATVLILLSVASLLQ